MVLKNVLLDYWREIHKKAGYVEISTPIILNRSLWETSGHWDHYKNNMYTTVIDDEDYAIDDFDAYFSAIGKDKKKSNGTVKFILMEGQGRPVLRELSGKDVMHAISKS